MQVTVVDFAKDRVIYNMTGCTKEELDNKLNLFFTSEGYTLKSTEGETTTYTKRIGCSAFYLALLLNTT